MSRMSGRLAVAIHDVEPRSFARTRQIREWLRDRGIARATLLVIPAADLHPIGFRAPALACWLRGRTAVGDVVAQHGLAHRRAARAPFPRNVLAHWQGGDAAEFPGLDAEDAGRRVDCGRQLLRDIELDPRGFVAPGYAYTNELRTLLSERFDWFADLRGVSSGAGRRLHAPALCLGTSTPLKRRFSPAVVRATARRGHELMRLDIHPADFDHPGHVATLEALLERAAGHEAVTYDQLVG
jgi:predicted deacetylase